MAALDEFVQSIHTNFTQLSSQGMSPLVCTSLTSCVCFANLVRTDLEGIVDSGLIESFLAAHISVDFCYIPPDVSFLALQGIIFPGKKSTARLDALVSWLLRAGCAFLVRLRRDERAVLQVIQQCVGSLVV